MIESCYIQLKEISTNVKEYACFVVDMYTGGCSGQAAREAMGYGCSESKYKGVPYDCLMAVVWLFTNNSLILPLGQCQILRMDICPDHTLIFSRNMSMKI